MDACRRDLTPVVVLAVAVVAVLIRFCPAGGGGPSSSTPLTTIPRASPSPTPITDIGDAFKDANCPLGKGSPSAECSRKGASLSADMDRAMDQLVQQKPQIFNLKDEYQPGTHAYKILDREAYMNGLVANLRAVGLCSERDADDALQQTIWVKDSADFSEDYDVLLSSGYMRGGNGSYRQTCTPAAFPVDRPADAPPIGSGCGRPNPRPSRGSTARST